MTDQALQTVAAALGAVPVAASARWSRPRALPAADVVWGRGVNEAAPVAAIGQTVTRWLAMSRLRIAPVAGHRLAAVHRVPARQLGGRLGRARSVVRAGAVAELPLGPRHDRPIDEILRRTGAAVESRRMRVLSAGVLVLEVTIDGAPAILRVATGTAVANLERAQDVARALVGRGIDLVPTPFGAGRVGSLGWSLEARRSGRRPRGVDAALVREVSVFLASLITAGTPRWPSEDAAGFGVALPTEIDDALADLPVVVRHGDLWAGNVLTDHGHLSGVVDWDGTCMVATPGTDLLHLLATDHRLRTRCSLGTVWQQAPWNWPRFVDAPYWDALGVVPSPEQRYAIGVAWWAAQVAGDAERDPVLLDDERWRTENIDAVVAALAVAR